MNFRIPHVQARWTSPLGPMILAADADGLRGLWFEGQKHPPDTRDWPDASTDHPLLQQAISQLERYFAGDMNAFDLPLLLSDGTPFQRQVWQALRAIAPGETTSYATLAARIGRPAAVRAVGAAVGRNPLSIIVPCHRVLGARGELTGYAGGLERKTALLRLEGILLA